MVSSTLKLWIRGMWPVIVAATLYVPTGGSTAQADDDWRERWEDYREDLEEQREEAREDAEERWEDEQERLEEFREERRFRRPRAWRHWSDEGGYYLPPPQHLPAPQQLPPPQRYRADYHHAPPAEYHYPEGPVVYRYPEPYRGPYRARYYGVPGAGYVEGPFGERSVQVGPIRVFWMR